MAILIRHRAGRSGSQQAATVGMSVTDRALCRPETARRFSHGSVVAGPGWRCQRRPAPQRNRSECNGRLYRMREAHHQNRAASQILQRQMPQRSETAWTAACRPDGQTLRGPQTYGDRTGRLDETSKRETVGDLALSLRQLRGGKSCDRQGRPSSRGPGLSTDRTGLERTGKQRAMGSNAVALRTSVSWRASRRRTLDQPAAIGTAARTSARAAQ